MVREFKPWLAIIKVVCIQGSLAGELRDEKQNGELRQVVSSSEYGAAYDDEVAGVVLYDEGFILLTGSWALNPADTEVL